MHVTRRTAILFGIVVLTATMLLGPLASASGDGPKPKAVSQAKGGNCYSPRWSHDGNRLSYEAHFPSRDTRETFFIDFRRGRHTQVKPSAGPSALGGFAEKSASPPVIELAWHPKGRSFIYSSTGGRSMYDIYMQGEGILTADNKLFSPGNRVQSRWSPCGRYVIYAKEMVGGGDIFRFNLFELEKGESRITDTKSGTSYQPAYSPDGKRVVFTRFQESNSENDLYVIDDVGHPGATTRRLTRLPGDELNPSWSPNGRTIAFFSNSGNEDGKVFDLYVVPASGGGPTRLVRDVLKPDRGGPVWTPDSNRIVFAKRDHEKQDPIMWVSAANPKQSGVVPTNTELNEDIALFHSDDSFKLAFTALAEKGDTEKTWRKVYVIDLPRSLITGEVAKQK